MQLKFNDNAVNEEKWVYKYWSCSNKLNQFNDQFLQMTNLTIPWRPIHSNWWPVNMKNPHFFVWRLQDPIRSYKTPYSFKSFFCALIWYPVRYFVWWPCKVCCLVPHGTFLIKYGTFVRYLSYYVPLLTFWDLESAHFSAKFGRHNPHPTPSQYSAGCTYAKLPEQLWPSDAKNWMRYGQSQGIKFGIYFCDFLLDNSGFYVQKNHALFRHKVRG